MSNESVQVGIGGAGGAALSNGSAGTRSIVALQPSVVAQNMVAISGNAGAAGGVTNSAAAAAGETVSTQTTATFYTLSNFISTAGRASTAYISDTNVTPFTSQITSAGAGGSNGQLGGNSILSSSLTPLLPGGASVSGSGLNAENGRNGITSFKPFFSIGGSGGGEGINTGGRGGKGGDGLVVIVAF